MDLLKVLVLELLAVDALAAGAISFCEIAALNHEALDDTVKARALVVQRLASLAYTLLASAQRAEVLRCLGDDVIVLFTYVSKWSTEVLRSHIRARRQCDQP